MSMAMILAPGRGLPNACSGLDWTYRMHKWPGIAAWWCRSHWLIAKGPSGPSARLAGKVADPAPATLERTAAAAAIGQSRGLAELRRRMGLYAALVLMVLAL
jgi:predicted ferric reductase